MSLVVFITFVLSTISMHKSLCSYIPLNYTLHCLYTLLNIMKSIKICSKSIVVNDKKNQSLSLAIVIILIP